MGTANFAMHRLPHCCGAVEVGAFYWEPNTTYFGPDRGNGANQKEAWKHALRKILDPNRDPYMLNTKGKAVQFWFKKSPAAKTWSHAGPLRKLLIELGATKIAGPYRNPNSGNTIEGYILFNDGNITIE
jgi:hypothetical protein